MGNLLKIAGSMGLLLLGSIGLAIFSSDKRNPGQPKRLRVPEGFVVEQVAGPELIAYPMFATLDPTGRLFVSESTGPNTMTTEQALENPTNQIRLLEDVDGDGFYDRSRVFANRIPLPQGGVFYEGSLYVAAAPDLLRLTDGDGDGVAEQREVVLTGWVLNINANSLIGPFLGPDGWLYLTSAITGFQVGTKEGATLQGKTSRVWRCRPDGTRLESIAAAGANNLIELTFTPSGEVLGTMTFFTEARAGQRDALMHWVEGGVYPKPNVKITADQLKRTGDLMPVMTKYAGVGSGRPDSLSERRLRPRVCRQPL